MKRTIVLLLAALLLLSACSGRKNAELERFVGETVATVVGSPLPWTPDENSFMETPMEEPTPEIESTTDPDSSSDETIVPTVEEPTIQPIQGAYPIETLAPPPAYPVTTPTAFRVDWSGAWNIWFQDGSGSYTQSIMTLQIQNNNLTGTAKIGNVEYSFTGSIENRDQVRGEWKTTVSSNSFWWILTEEGQFSGSWAERFGFCGNKFLTVQPGDCRKIPTE